MQEAHTNPHHARRWLILFVIAIAQLMVVLDATVVNIALPSAQEALDFSNDQRQWVITAYALAFGSLLLLGGRIGDLFGRKRAFVDRPGRLRRRERARRLRAELRGARRRPRPAGRLRRAARARRAVAPDDDVHRPRGARQGVRHLRRRRGRRRRDRPDPRRRADRSTSTGAGACTSTSHSRCRRRWRRWRCCTTSSPSIVRGSTSPARSPRRPACSRSSTASRTPRRTAGPTR